MTFHIGLRSTNQRDGARMRRRSREHVFSTSESSDFMALYKSVFNI